jgi:hypothetical protein
VDFITPTDFKNDSKYLSSTTRKRNKSAWVPVWFAK